MSYCPLNIIFFNYIVSTTPSWKWLNPSPHAGVDLTPHTTALTATTGRGRLIFSGYFCFLHHFRLCLLATSQFISNWTAMVLPWEQLKLSPQTELFLPPYITTLPTTTGSGEYIFVVCFHVNCIFYKWFIAILKYFFNSSSMVLPWEGPKLSPQTEFGLPPHTTTLPTTTGSSGYIFVVRFRVPWIVYKCCIAMSKAIFN